MKTKLVSSLLFAGALMGCNTGTYSDESAKLLAITPDKTPPQILQFFPADGATDVAVSSNVQIKLNENLAQHCINAEHVRLYAINQSKPVDGDVTFDSEQNLLIFTPEKALQYGTLYRLYLGESLRDDAGNSLSSIHWTFSTQVADKQNILANTDSCEPICNLKGLNLDTPLGETPVSADFPLPSSEKALDKGLEHVDAWLEHLIPDKDSLEVAEQTATQHRPDLYEQIQKLTAEDDFGAPRI